MKNFIAYDFETTGRDARFDQVLQAGFIIYDQNFNELKKLNIKSRLNPDIVPSINALKVNKLSISDILSERDSYYEMTLNIHKLLSEFKNSYFVGFNSINFDEVEKEASPDITGNVFSVPATEAHYQDFLAGLKQKNAMFNYFIPTRIGDKLIISFF